MLLYDGGVQTKPRNLVYGVKTALFCGVCERDGKAKQAGSFWKTEFSRKTKAFVWLPCVKCFCSCFCCTDTCQTTTIALSRFIDLSSIGTFASWREEPSRGSCHGHCCHFELKSLTFALNYRPVDVIIYALAEITALCLIVSCLPSPCCQLKGPGVLKPFTLVVWLIALHKSFPSYFLKIGLFSIFFLKW